MIMYVSAKLYLLTYVSLTGASTGEAPSKTAATTWCPFYHRWPDTCIYMVVIRTHFLYQLCYCLQAFNQLGAEHICLCIFVWGSLAHLIWPQQEMLPTSCHNQQTQNSHLITVFGANTISTGLVSNYNLKLSVLKYKASLIDGCASSVVWAAAKKYLY